MIDYTMEVVKGYLQYYSSWLYKCLLKWVLIQNIEQTEEKN